MRKRFIHRVVQSKQKLLGLRWPGLYQAVVILYLLTVLLYLGPIYICEHTAGFIRFGHQLSELVGVGAHYQWIAHQYNGTTSI